MSLEQPGASVLTLALTPIAGTRHLHADQHQATAVFGRIGVVVWRGDATLPAVHRVRDMGLATLGSSTQPIGLIGIVENSATAPDEAARRLSAQVNDELAHLGAVGFAAVLPQPGFAGAWVRGVVTGLNLLARRRYPFRTYESSSEACSWLFELLEDTSTSWKSTAEAIELFREDYRRCWADAHLKGVDRSSSPSSP